MRATAVVALLSFPAFWINGYGPTQIGSVSLPLGSIVSGWNGLTWIAFALLYYRATSGLRDRPLPVQLWDWAIVLLLLACSGAVGLVVLVVLDHPSLFLQQTMLHLFLDLFAVGWFMLALLGLLWAWIAQNAPLPPHMPAGSIAFMLAPTFFLGMPPVLVPEHIYWISTWANLGAVLLLATHLWQLWKLRRYLPALARFGLFAFAIHLLAALVLLWPDFWQWSAATQLRVFFLHNLLLGWLSSVLLAIVASQWIRLAPPMRLVVNTAWLGGAGLMLLALLALGVISLWAPAPATVWLNLAAWSSLLLVSAILLITVLGLHTATHDVDARQSEWRHIQPAKGAG
jgi:hypothetical protein